MDFCLSYFLMLGEYIAICKSVSAEGIDQNDVVFARNRSVLMY